MRRVWLFLSLVLLLWACAQQRPISGGEKDEIPPKIVSSSPQNEELNFRDNSFLLEFDEYVVVQSLSQALLVSPPLAEDPEIKMSGKKVKISWEDSLAQNTTYVFQFGDGIKDLNEGNVLDSNVFVFSTGSYIDSLSYRGKVVDAFTLQPVKEVKVMLYKSNVDSLPLTKNPSFYGITDKDGYFDIKYLPKSVYKAVALEGVNPGFLYDLPTERIGFSDSTVQSRNYLDSLSYDSTLAVFKLFKKPDTSQFITNTIQDKDRAISFAFNKPPKNLEIKELIGLALETCTKVWNDDKDSVTYWFPESIEYDSLKFLISAAGFNDTIYLRKPSEKKRKGVEEKLALTTEKKIYANQPLIISSESPLGGFESDTVFLISDTDTVNVTEKLKLNEFSLELANEWVKGQGYKLYIPRNSVFNKYNLFNDSLVLSFGVYKDEDLGTAIIKNQFPNQEISYVWQLLNGSGELIKTFSTSASDSILLENRPVGDYQIRVVFDENGNGKWDSGFYELNQQPERILFYEEKLNIKAGWTSEIEWIIKD